MLKIVTPLFETASRDEYREGANGFEFKTP